MRFRPASDAQPKLLWLVLFRLVATTVILGVVASKVLLQPSPTELTVKDSLAFGLIGLAYGSTLGFLLDLIFAD